MLKSLYSFNRIEGYNTNCWPSSNLNLGLKISFTDISRATNNFYFFDKATNNFKISGWSVKVVWEMFTKPLSRWKQIGYQERQYSFMTKDFGSSTRRWSLSTTSWGKVLLTRLQFAFIHTQTENVDLHWTSKRIALSTQWASRTNHSWRW